MEQLLDCTVDIGLMIIHYISIIIERDAQQIITTKQFDIKKTKTGTHESNAVVLKFSFCSRLTEIEREHAHKICLSDTLFLSH